MQRICVFCGSKPGLRPEYLAAAQGLGQLLAERGLELVYGGGNIGLMGAIADACLAAGGPVTGVIPRSLVGREVSGRAVEHIGLTRLEVVDSMHTRKARMAELADGFIALPGGYGTFEELFEILTWAQLGFHGKPVGLLNVAGYYAPLLALRERAAGEGFISQGDRELLLIEDEPEALLDAMAGHQPPAVKRWVRYSREL